ncbi:MAG: NAD(P)H-dependent oxidoreductase [Nocardioidaceae bacterium]|nr:MAG: NAD(P)H-dependent oxidoreductase [Nocardioidaceae bacterium]
MKIGIVVGSIREGRRGRMVGDWVKAQVAGRDDAEFEIVDLKEYDVPLLTAATLPSQANRQYDSEGARRWSAAIDACDGFIFVTPEYNHGVPGAFKNAIDTLGPEWLGKKVGFVSYGADAGVRAVEQWRQIVVNFQMVDVRGQVALSTFAEFGDEGFTPLERRTVDLGNLLDQLLAATARSMS